MVAAVVVVGHEGFDLGFQIAREVVAPQQDAVFERLVPALDLALGFIEWCGAPPPKQADAPRSSIISD
jgi:hypothetical protein